VPGNAAAHLGGFVYIMAASEMSDMVKLAAIEKNKITGNTDLICQSIIQAYNQFIT